MNLPRRQFFHLVAGAFVRPSLAMPWVAEFIFPGDGRLRQAEEHGDIGNSVVQYADALSQAAPEEEKIGSETAIFSGITAAFKVGAGIATLLP